MIFEARCQSFKILLMMLIFVGSTFVANCRAERTPVSPDRQSFCLELIGADAVRHFETVKQERQRGERLWSDFKLFASEQASLAKQKWASLDLENWWEQRSSPAVSPAVQRQPVEVAKTATTSVAAMVTNYAANMTSLQWLQLSHLTTDLLNSGRQQVDQAVSKLEADLQASLLELAKSTSIDIVQLAQSRQISGMSQAMSAAESSSSSNADSQVTTKSTDVDPTADPYWQYYTDCDFWGAQFEAEKE